MKKTLIHVGLFIGLFFGWIPSAFSLDGFYLGGEVGHLGLTGNTQRTYSNTIGFGLDLGLRTNSMLDVVLHSGYSSHSGGANGMSLMSEALSANYHFWQFNDFDFSLGGGPGFYFFSPKGASTESKFGLNVGLSVDVLADDHLRVGLGWRWHSIFSGVVGDSYWSVMMRFGYQFNS